LGGALAETGAGAVIAGLGFLATNIGAELTVVNDINQANSVTAQQNCLGGLLGNPPQGSKNPLDAIMTQTTATQLYEGTQTSPLYLTVATLMNYPPANPPWAFGACQAATNIVFIIDRPRNPSTFAWTNGLAFQPRAADSAVVRRRNAVESFRVDPVHRRIEHDSWRYSPFQDSLDSSNPSVGLALCNRPQSCSPHAWAEPVGGYIAGAVDPSGQHPPALTNRGRH
jgi:hypothetical protein